MRSCSLRVFTYPSLQEPLRALLQFIANETAKDRRHLPCDLDDESCKIDSFGLTARQYTADVPIRNALLNRCRIIANPDEADIFLVPYLYGVSSTITWGKYWHFSEREAIKNLRTKGMKLLWTIFVGAAKSHIFCNELWAGLKKKLEIDEGQLQLN